ncbi:hypothetical protein ACWC3Y_27350 [Streptomyces sp. NPDC001296]
MPAIAASTTLIVGGAYGIADGINRFSDGLGQALREASEADSAAGGGGVQAGALGDRREEYVADLIGGKVAKGPNGQDIKIVMPNVGSSGIDVIGPNGEYVYVGGGAKAANPAKFGKALKINKYAADEAGVPAIYYLDASNTPESAINQARKVFGVENVHTFNLPKG